ncbi:MAG: Disulfide-bond oxidoreductase YfcG [Alphaproteobacteria bacterium MarineAlpha10_Bin3]|jgi:GST-like protein|nr:MAG: Disulfide-bond oxidoreductase YfcG [Alphaproteobacteria bacterium MarineAlpha10_Bin3]PPR70077.1 MAG: Disulfide-bond oxidoreductase YfcG [Alphaproteobacteria bacterium MarineAlpha4_Bin1]
MIELYTWPTPNGHKVHIMLEECGLEYDIHPIDIGAGDQFDPEFLKISPNNKMPAMVDTDGPDGAPVSIFESGAILWYLAEKTGKFIPSDPRGRIETLQWLMFQMGGIGPMLGQAHHFRNYAPERIQYAYDRYTNEAGRLYRVVDRRLEESPWTAGNQYGIVDMAIFPWLRSHENQGQDLNDYPALKRWYEAIEARPAVVRGVAVLADRRRPAGHSKEAWEIMFGAKQYEKR